MTHVRRANPWRDRRDDLAGGAKAITLCFKTTWLRAIPIRGNLPCQGSFPPPDLGEKSGVSLVSQGCSAPPRAGEDGRAKEAAAQERGQRPVL